MKECMSELIKHRRWQRDVLHWPPKTPPNKLAWWSSLIWLWHNYPQEAKIKRKPVNTSPLCPKCKADLVAWEEMFQENHVCK